MYDQKYFNISFYMYTIYVQYLNNWRSVVYFTLKRNNCDYFIPLYMLLKSYILIKFVIIAQEIHIHRKHHHFMTMTLFHDIMLSRVNMNICCSIIIM